MTESMFPAMDFGWWGDRDIAAAVSFLARQPGVRAGQIAVLGESMGGEQALAAAGSDPRIRAVVAEGVTGQQLADHGWLPHGVDGALQRGMEWVSACLFARVNNNNVAVNVSLRGPSSALATSASERAAD